MKSPISTHKMPKRRGELREAIRRRKHEEKAEKAEYVEMPNGQGPDPETETGDDSMMCRVLRRAKYVLNTGGGVRIPIASGKHLVDEMRKLGASLGKNQILKKLSEARKSEVEEFDIDFFKIEVVPRPQKPLSEKQLKYLAETTAD